VVGDNADHGQTPDSIHKIPLMSTDSPLVTKACFRGIAMDVVDFFDEPMLSDHGQKIPTI